MDYENEIKIIKEQITTLREKIEDIVHDLRNQQFKVGDRVQFKTWEEMENEFGVDGCNNIKTYFPFLDVMSDLCGTYATIKEIKGSRIILEDFTCIYNTNWNYSLDMLKHAENEPKWVFTEDEKAILRNIDEDYKYITRDSFGDLELFMEEPSKRNNYWGSSCDNEFFDIFNNIFKCIKWEDEEPCEFRKYI